nr:cytochrome P450 [Tanacetum cinerariifolium]
MKRDVNGLLERCRTCHMPKLIVVMQAGRFRKLKPRGDGPFRVLKKINNNAYKIELPGHYNASTTFNVADLSPYKGDSDDDPDSGSSLFQEGEDDADAVNERINTGEMPPKLNKTLVTLIPKTTSTENLSQFWPISLCNFHLQDYIKGDPISPYLFIIVVDVRSRQISKAMESHSLAAYGQSDNFQKSSAFFSHNTPTLLYNDICDALHVQLMDSKAKYLGMPLVYGKKKGDLFAFLLQKGKVLKGLYFSNCGFLVAKRGSHPSWIWSSLLHGHDLLLQGVRWQVGDGRDISFWTQKWIPYSEDFYIRSPLGPFKNSGYPHKCLVKINCDAAFKDSTAAYGIVVRDSVVTLVRVSAYNQGWRGAIVDLDSQTAISLSSSEAPPPWSLGALIDDICTWSKSLHLTLSWVNRVNNQVAHWTAQFTLSLNQCIMWDVSFLYELTSLARSDLYGS